MKSLYKLMFLAFFMLFALSCEEDGGSDALPEFDPPTITILFPDLANGELTPTVGETVTFDLSYTAPAGLSQVFVNETSIKKYDGSDQEATISYEYLVQNEDSKEFVFTIEDAYGTTTATSPVKIVPVPGEDLGFILLDFAGQSTASEDKEIVDWDKRKLTTFRASGSLANTASVEVVHSQAQIFFAQANPEEGGARAQKIIKQPTADFDNWGGWAHIIYNLKGTVPVTLIDALPQWDAAESKRIEGSKVIKVDAYYDATVDPNFTWTDLLALTGVYNADPSLGYKIDLSLANYAKHATVESAHDASGYYIGYSAYIPEPNKWVTLTFEMIDEGRVGNFFASGSAAAASASEIDCIDIKPSPGYIAEDTNPLYFRNLRIVDVE